MAIGFAATLAGQLGTASMVRAVGRRSLIVWAMVALLALGSAVMVYQVGSQAALVARAAEGGAKLTAFGDVCR
jgi:hypothetical protein